MSSIDFGTNLKKLRKKHGYSREELAQMISYSKKSVEKWELGCSVPPLETVCKLSEIFGVTIDMLVYQNIENIRFLLGIDGGGTKTEFLLTDLDKKEIKRICLGSSNPVDIGIENCKQILEKGIKTVCEGINLRQVSVFAGLSGGSAGDYCAQINKFLSEFSFGCFANGSDTKNALEMSLGDSDGIIVIMGTGIVAIVRQADKCERIGGWGYLIDKGGSGYNFGVDALDSAYKYIDGRGGSLILKNLIEKEIGKPLVDSVSDIYLKGKSYVASFAPFVFEAYAMNDTYAKEIINKNMKEAAMIITSGVGKFSEKPMKVVISGGLCRYEDILKPALISFLDIDCDIIFINESMVNGAVTLAKKEMEKKQNA